MSKKFELKGHIYTDSSNREPIMVAPEDGSSMKLRSLERYLKEAELFPTLYDAGKSVWDKGEVFVPQKHLKKVKVTVIVEEV